jgi:hypothetical protein
MPILDPATAPAGDVHTDTRPLAGLVPCDVTEDYHPAGECPTPFHCPEKEDR